MKATRQDACAAVLGAVFLSDTALTILQEERIRPEHFYDPAHALIYRAMLTLAADNQPVDTLTVKSKVPDTQRATVDALAAAVPNLGSLRGYCAIVRDEHWYEHAGQALTQAADAVHARDRQAIFAALATVDQTDTTRQHGPDNWEALLDWYENKTATGIPLPFEQLTEAVGGGLQPGETTMLAGWPTMGKTLLAMNIMLHAVKHGHRVHDYANENVGPRRTARIVSSLTGIPGSRIRRRELRQDERARIVQITNQPPYKTSAAAGWRAEDYCRELRREKWDLAVIDTVTRIPARDTADWDRISGMLADVAAQTGTHLILVSQLNLERDKGALRPAPTGRDLRNTGAWYQDARNVIFVHRDQELVDGTHIPRVLPDGHIRVDKATHGDGADGFVEVTLRGDWLRFEELGAHRRPLEVAA